MGGAVALVVLALAQTVRIPHENPAVNSARSLLSQGSVPEDVLKILNRACKDCHTVRTDWRWYSHFPPVMWLQVGDVYVARSHMNHSQWEGYSTSQKAERLEHMCSMVLKGKMPLWYYQPLHPSSDLSRADVDRLCQWTEEEHNRLTSGVSSR